ncbi:sugar fermentation stimulation protein [Methylopila jiangsuensis]|uniref:Sugar fermentation stimulation protein homolog n=1 Tax=Methylopila jiangsuensis TaxID=586230 RepID=A0A9W6N2L7_9HYPH|nr:DNA/RNA nuclease SfsA [Methylopila jiangsuensis]MDR6285404.1 sugar fermentation stimulation protein A [Methylopila jiangsuensis]GLK75162.1 sugar fermentation stimulation protein [Methylopila jiangsuensis]
MLFPSPLVPGRLVRRYKRFLADVVLDDGREVTAHVANSGAMLGLSTPGLRVWLRPKTGGTLAWSWAVVEVEIAGRGELVGVDTAVPNALGLEAVSAGVIPAFAGYGRVRREVRYGVNSRIDLLLEAPDRPPAYVEIKNVHMWRRDRRAEFPDARTARGAKHLAELSAMAAAGARAAMLFIVQGPGDDFVLARDIDPAYGAAFDAARAAGVEAHCWTSVVTLEGVTLDREIPIVG